MKIPLAPFYIDEFPSIQPNESLLFGLTHFHSDHMRGLTENWGSGPVLCSRITRELVAHRFPRLDNLLYSVPFFERRQILAAGDDLVFVTLLPAFHIPGSAMFYVETPQANFLHTGDFKFENNDAREVLRLFFNNHLVDHLFLDDTWLHLGVEVESGTAENNGSEVLSKLLNASQVDEAIDSLGRRMSVRREHHAKGGEGKVPFFLRVYLHNQFGKEVVVQKVAERLGTRVIVDDQRYERLSIVSECLSNEQLATPTPGAEAWASLGGERWFYVTNIDYFISQTSHKMTPAGEQKEEPPLMEVVGSRADIAPSQLEHLSSTYHAPVYGLVMSGWARMQKATSENLWHMPTTLHSTPQEIMDFVKMIQPKSVTPLHGRASRASFILKRLGPYLATPYQNDYFSGSVTSPPCPWKRSICTEEEEHGDPPQEPMESFGLRLRTVAEEEDDIKPLWSDIELSNIDPLCRKRPRT